MRTVRAYSPSPSPVEDYGSDADEQEWTVSGVVGESVDGFGQHRYVVKWGDNWRRQDGSNTTWEKPGTEGLQHFFERWDKQQRAKRMAKAQRSPEIEVGVASHHMLHEDRTIELARGYEELKKLYLPNGMDPRQPIDFDGMRKKVPGRASPPLPQHVVDARALLAQRKASQRSNAGSGPRTRTPASSSASSSSRSPSPVQGRRPVRPLPRRAGVRRAVSSAAPDSEEEPAGGSASRAARSGQRRQFKRRKSLEFKWARALQGAKSVTFVNEVNYEEVPSLVENFKYLERGYVRAPDVPSNAEVADCLVSCECDDRCDDAAECGCQGPSELVNSSGERIFAYTQRGLFNFALLPGMEAIECNDSCSCDETCPNRVAQRPRDVPIEVFRTRNCGWGARATVALPPGKVLGIYTGLLIRREEADTYQGERKSYIFDLDVHEGADDDDETDKYSVDGHAHGNWTRFVNHSCEPNLRVYPVVWDTIPELNQPYLAFVAMKNIPPRTELTIDYDPKAAEEARRSKGKHRQRTPEGARHCMCGSANCRGWVRV
ncbi:SET domain-containing protein [Lentinus tigrinus ALCF2SS1-6]|uniref:SET domain-containing protein n=1 Tax=Lentinus tigrinus ALCF2SS1-6 TaxID=1328759 RepID=A0A5C2SAU7_9APHY|nr:SET domain-containing protein [Lentinus tigrinus ALCF2SS1-6]